MIDFLGKGWKFPIRVNGRGGLSYVSGEDSVAEAIWIILSTPKNSRIMEPEFGCGIHDTVFDSNTPNTRAMVAHSVERALMRWEPRIDVLSVQTRSNPETPNLLLIEVDYQIRANNALRNLVYPFYITEGKG
ncbi:MAG: GPW/gp25 family protein [Chloroflexi bacterium]|nr:GPW/gp25 family protein [Chloroflexota bacterium]